MSRLSSYLFSLNFILLSSMTLASSLAPPLTEQWSITPTGHEAETLYSIEESLIDEGGYWTETRYHSIRINSLDAARDYGRIVIRFDDHYSDLSLDFARVMTADRKIKEVEESAVKSGLSKSSQDFYDELKELAFSLPHIEPGSIIEFQTTRRTKTRAIETMSTNHVDPYWYQRMIAGDGWRADPVINYRYSLTHPDSVKFYNTVYGDFPKKPKITSSNGKTTSLWEWKKIPELVIEAGMPPSYEVTPMISSSTVDSWKNVDEWFWGLVADKLETTPKLQAVIDDINRNFVTEEEKIQAVYAYIQNNIRYVYAHMGRGGYTPHFPDEVLNTRYGDCKDQTVLAIALLKGLDVEAYPLLVQTPNGGKDDIKVPRLIYDHVLVYIPSTLQRESIYMDTTGDRSLFPGMSSYLDGQPALLADGRGKEAFLLNLEQLNKATLNMKFSQTKKNQSAVDVTLTYEGFYEQNVRSWWKSANNRETSLRQSFSSIYEDKGQYHLTYSVVNEDSFSQPIMIKGRFLFEEPIAPDMPFDYGASINQLGRIFGLFSGFQIPETRANTFQSRLPFELELKAKFDSYQDFTQAIVQSSDDIDTPYFTIKNTLQQKDDGYQLNINYKQPSLNLSIDEYTDYFLNIQKLGASGHWAVRNQKMIANSEAAKLENLKNKAGENTVEYRLQLTKSKLDKGEFEQALPIAQTLVKDHQGNAEAWFLLGTVMGYLGDIDNSMAAFEKSKQLGYVP